MKEEPNRQIPRKLTANLKAFNYLQWLFG